MLMKANTATRPQLVESKNLYALLIALVCVGIAVVSFRSSLQELVHRWTVQEEYSHGFLIPFISAWLLWTRRTALVESLGRPSWWGPALILIAGATQVLGTLSAVFVLPQLGFIIALIGIVLSIGGLPLLRVSFVPIIFLIFAIPMPYFVDSELSWRLQIISSELGTAFIRMMQIPVFLQGNVIDLGTYKLQVVEACSGLRYLYPLLSLGFLAAYLFRAPFWQKALIFLSAIPITIFMNSLRIGIVGVLVDNFGPQDADGFLHMFEGWIIFLACAFLLVAEMAILTRFRSGKGFFDVFSPPEVRAVKPAKPGPYRLRSAGLACLLLLCGGAVATASVSARQEIIPQRRDFATFPSRIGAWQGRTSSLDAGTLKVLGLSDYILSDYAKAGGPPVNLYVAYYSSQRSGLSPHSPSVCLPGNGWQIAKFRRTYFRQKDGSFPINRVIISRESQKQLVYYWFEERGMTVANEWWAKFYLLRDAIFKNRTDGALVRLTTPIYPGETEADADKRLHAFTDKLLPTLSAYLPREKLTQTASR